MNCREAERQIFAERDGVLAPDQRVALATHVTHCAACRRKRDNLAAAIEAWRVTTHTAAVPDADREWQAIRRRRRSEIHPVLERTGGRRRNVIPWLAVPFAAAAAVAIALFVTPPSPPSPVPTAAIAESAAPPAEDASTVVFVDEKSGWLVVWASAGGTKQI